MTPDEQSSQKLGLSVQNLTADLEQQLGYENEHGVIVTDVKPGGPADEAGLQSGDLIKSVNRKSVASVKDFYREVKNLKSGDSVALLIRRGDGSIYVGIEIP
jgi:serine protease Do